jgi:hypothetical protein
LLFCVASGSRLPKTKITRGQIEGSMIKGLIKRDPTRGTQKE